MSVPPQHGHVLLCAEAMTRLLASSSRCPPSLTRRMWNDNLLNRQYRQRSKVGNSNALERHMEENEGVLSSRGTKRGLFTIPSVSEIKTANKVSVVTSAPILFNQSKPVAQKATNEVAVPPSDRTTTTTTTTSSQPKSLVSGHHTNSTGKNVSDGDINTGSIQSRKRPREDPEISAEIPSKLAVGANNERVRPRLGNLHGHIAAAPTTGGSTLTATSTSNDNRKLLGGASVAVSEGEASSFASTSVAAVHHPHAIIANPVQVCQDTVELLNSTNSQKRFLVS